MTSLAGRIEHSHDGAADRSTPAPDLPTVLFVSPVADMKGGGERVLLDLLDNPMIRAALAVPSEGELASAARERRIPVALFDLGAVASVHRPPRPSDLLNASRASLRCAAQLAEAATRFGASLLHTNGLKVHVIGALTRRRHGVPVIAHIHDIPHTRLEKTIWRAVTAGVSRSIVVSRPCYPGKSLPANVTVVSNGVRAGGMTVAPRVLDTPPVIGFVGRFHPFKGLHLLIDWFETISPSRPGLKLLVRGRADAEGAAYWEQLRPRVDALVASGRCRLLGWAGAGQDAYEGIDVLAVPSEIPDPAPLVVVEAMLRGIPVIGYPAGGIPGLIGAGDCGAFAASATEFAAALDRLTGTDAYTRISEAAMTRARTVFSIERFWANVNAQYALCLPGLARYRA
jgi:glycosyltransferase involved in cell wall biosynthesis